ncbi:MAG: isopenicillin N synthase family oxygenase [Rhodobacteraceae bacterium]|nr:isopenicillin N synthase family oxygenase [Paracoccaceae bacterium]
MTGEFTEIPVIDMAWPRPRLTEAFRRAYGGTGFGYVVNHGVAQRIIDDVFDASVRFHARPLAEKMEVAVNEAHRGYIPLGTSTDVTTELARVTRPNQSASFMMMREDRVARPDTYLSGPNQWPDLPGFRPALETCVGALSGLARQILGVAFEAAGVTDPDAMRPFDEPTIWLRLLHYPPAPPDRPGDLYGSAPHVDFGALTLLAQDDAGGLQVRTPAGAWVDAPALPGSFVVNVGQMLQRMTNGRLRATPHRVINLSGRARFSCPFFFDPHVHTVVAPLPGTGTPRFDPLVFGEFLRAELQAGYEAHKPRTAGRLSS